MFGSLIAPGIGTAIGCIGGIAGDYFTEELRKMGWLKPIEDMINGVVNFMKPVYEGFFKEIGDTFNETKETFGLIVDIGKIVLDDIKYTFEGITKKLSEWWDGFNETIIKLSQKHSRRLSSF